MKKILLITTLCASLFLLGCDNSPIEDTQACGLTTTTGNACATSSGETNTNLTALDTAKAILQTLKDKDIQTLVTYINTDTKVRFSPYTYVNTDTDIMMDAQELLQAYQSATGIIGRGIYDGSGEPINLTTQDYFQKFVYDLDFLNAPEVYENQEIMRGNVINNINDVYPNAHIVEFYIPGIDPQYEGMDRRSLTIVLKNTDGARHLIGIVHNQRTI